MHCFFDAIFIDFGVILEANIASKKQIGIDMISIFFQDVSKTPQEHPKSAPRGPRSAPRAAKSDPRLPQDTSRAPQKPPKRTQPCPKERKSRNSHRKATITGNNAENQIKNSFLITRFIGRGEFSSAGVGEG